MFLGLGQEEFFGHVTQRETFPRGSSWSRNIIMEAEGVFFGA